MNLAEMTPAALSQVAKLLHERFPEDRYARHHNPDEDLAIIVDNWPIKDCNRLREAFSAWLESRGCRFTTAGYDNGMQLDDPMGHTRVWLVRESDGLAELEAIRAISAEHMRVGLERIFRSVICEFEGLS